MKVQKALFAAGCFWGIQYYFDQVPGVLKTTVGYSGGDTESPSYDQVASRMTGHAESVLIEFDADKVSYQTLLKHFFHLHDPTQKNSQWPEYRSMIQYFDQEQHKEAITVRNETQKQIDQPIATEIVTAHPFYKAEAYHQKFTEHTGLGMCYVPYAPVK